MFRRINLRPTARSPRRRGVSLALLALPLVATAQPAGTTGYADVPPSEETVKLDPFVVTDANSLKTTLPVRPVAGVYGFETSYLDLPRSITQINPQQFESDIISSYSDFTRYSPSVNQSTGQIANYGSPTMRGSKSDAYQNGVRLLTRQQNNRPFTLNAYEAADIVAGPAPVIYGPTERTAGYVNYITKRPYFDRQHTTVNVRFGKFYGDGTGFRDGENWQIDTGGPIIPGKLGYRLSYQGENIDSYYTNGGDRYHDLYGTLAWVPHDGLTVDWNFEYGTFDWRVNNGANRVTTDFIRDGTYLAGPATPIIQVGTKYYSPVLNSAGAVTGWVNRTKSGTTYTAGAATADPTSNTAAGAGTIVGYVLDPSLVHPTKIADNTALNSPDYPSKTRAFNTQFRVKRTFSDRLTLVNNTLYQYYFTDTASNGGFYNWITTHDLENRTEGLFSANYTLFKLPIEHHSNTGFSYRFDQVKNYKDGQANGYGPTGDQYDLTAASSTFTRNAFFGATVYPFTGTTTTPVLTRYGYLKGFWTYLTVPESPNNYVTAGGSTTGTYGGNLSTAGNYTRTHALSWYTQHSLKIADRWLLDLGLRDTLLFSRIHNPLPLDATFANISDGIKVWLPGSSASLSYKPTARITAYATYSYVVAHNGMTTGSPTWATVNGATNQYDPAAFHSASELRETGVKAELIPGKLTSAISIYRQTRDLTFTAVPGADPVLAKGRFQGAEANLRFQPTKAFVLGVNYSYLDAVTLNQNPSVTNLFVADNATSILGTTSLGLGDWRITNLPHHNLTLYASYQFSNGFGVKTDLWLRDSYLVNASGSLRVPGEYNLNAAFFYNRPTWSVSLEFQNVTDRRNFAGASTVLEPFSTQARLTYRF